MATDKDKVYTSAEIDNNPLPNQFEGADFSTSQSTSNDTYNSEKTKDQPLPKKTTAYELISTSLNTRSKKILSEFQFAPSGALQIGKYENTVTGDIKISPNGIVGRDSDGTTTFAIDGTTGDAIFKGTIRAGSIMTDGTITGGSININDAFIVDTAGNLTATSATLSGAITGGTIDIGGSDSTSFHVDADGNMWLGSGSYVTAPFRVYNTGEVVASDLTLTNASIGSGSAYKGNSINQAYIGNLSAEKITTGTLSAITISGNTISGNTISSNTISGGTISGTNIYGTNIYGTTIEAGGGTGGIIIYDSDGLTFVDSDVNVGGFIFGISECLGIGSVKNIVLVPGPGCYIYASEDIVMDEKDIVACNEVWAHNFRDRGSKFRFFQNIDMDEYNIDNCETIWAHNFRDRGSKFRFFQNIDMDENNIDECDTIWAYNFNNRCEVSSGVNPFDVMNSFEADSKDKNENWKKVNHSKLHESIYKKTIGKEKKIVEGFSLNRLVELQRVAILELKEEVENLKLALK